MKTAIRRRSRLVRGSVVLGLAAAALLMGSAGVRAGTVILSVAPVTIPSSGCGSLVISTSNLTGLHAAGFSFRLQYNPAVYRFSTYVIKCPVACVFNTSFAVDSIAGAVAIMGWDYGDLQGAGPLVDVTFCNIGPSAVSNCRQPIWLDNAWVGDENEVGVTYPCTIEGTDATLDPLVSFWAAPNPFREGIAIHVLPASDVLGVKLEIFDVRGRLLHESDLGPARQGGDRVLMWDGRDPRGRPVPSGAYWARLRLGGHERTIKMIRGR